MTDESAEVTDTEQCPAGFTCTPNSPGPGPFSFTDTSGTIFFTKTITNVNAKCGSEFALTNIADLRTNDTGTELKSTDTTFGGITTPDCPVIPPAPVGCTPP